jgi:hypothetical protein
MDPVSAAVALLAPYLARAGEAAATKAGEAAVSGAKALLVMIRRRFSRDGDHYAQQTLARLEEKPEDQARQAALQGVLAEKAKEDPSFATELEQIVKQTTFDQPVAQFLTQVYGGKVGKIVNIGAAETVNID